MIGRQEKLRRRQGGSTEGTRRHAVPPAAAEPKRLGREGMEDLTMTLSSPKRPAIEKRMAPRAALLSGLALALGLSANGAAHATLPSSASYKVESQAFASGGVQATSSGYSLSGTVGQSSALGAGSSASYALAPGFQSTLDGDGDDYPNPLDAFPNDPTEWLDTDGDSIGNNADTDDDNDGMPDAWEIAWFGLPASLDASNASDDPDLDGFGNLEEYIAGTDPTDAVSRPIQTADFNYDFKSDILWRHDATGMVSIWQMDGMIQESAAVVGDPSTAWRIEGIGESNDDGRSDILWRNTVTDDMVIWLMDGLTRIGDGGIGKLSTVWNLEGLGDFDGDGRIDILWRHATNGNVVIWMMNGFAKDAAQSIGIPPLVWQIKGVADFNGDAKADILWRHSGTGSTIVWEMDGFNRTGAPWVGGPPTVWEIEGVGDFNGGGQPDILWRRVDNGVTVIWQMNGTTREADAFIAAPDLSWQVIRVGDYNGGGQADILWHNTNDVASIWQMDGLVRQDAQVIGNPAGWTPK
jgi:hypothetical protein